MRPHWQQRSVASLATYINGFPFKPDHHGTDGVPIVRIKQLNDPHADVDFFDGFVPARNRIDTGDLIFSWSGSLCVAVWDRGPAYLNQHLYKVEGADGIDKGWLRWALTYALDLFEPYMHGSAMTHITQPMMRQVRVPVAPLNEQRAISDFLNDQVGRMESVARLRSEQKSLLDARVRTMLIDSMYDRTIGAEQTGRPTSPWPIVELRRFVRKLSRPVPESSEVVTAFRDGFVGPRSMRRLDGFTMSDLEQGYQGVKKGDLVFHGLDGFAGAFGVAVADGRCTPVYHVIDTGTDSAAFVAYALRAAAAAGLIEIHVPSTRQRAVDFRNWETLGGFAIPRPPRSEQNRIVATLDRELSAASELANLSARSISLLSERMRSLITAAITGQLDPATMSDRAGKVAIA